MQNISGTGVEKSERRVRDSVGWKRRLWLFMRPLLIGAISLCIVGGLVYFGYNFLMDKFYRPVNLGDQNSVVLEIKPGSNTSVIADSLFLSDLIKNKAVFKVYVDFMGKGGKLRSGKYTLTRNMGIEEIVDRLVAGDGTKQSVVKIRVIEGMTIQDMADSLVSKGVLKDNKRFLQLTRSGESFKDLDFIKAIPILPSKERRYLLEGYLFPDTYEIYEGASEESIIKKLLNRFYNVFTDEYIARAKELGMTMDQVVTLASMIEKEAKTADFKKVSAVFHNRLVEKQKLESCATVQYIKGIKRLNLTEADISIDSLFNTYKYAGLPLGPICNPGKTAIEAALYPDEAYIQEKYLYFCLKDPAIGELVFTKTLKEHLAEVEKYRALWVAFDNAS